MEAEMTLRPMTAAEQPYCYSQPLSILNRVGCIGYLRGDLGVEDGVLLSTWQTYREDLKSDAFKQEFDSVLDVLRNDPQYGGILKNLNTMEKYCDAHADSELKTPDNYGFRVETEHYTCFLRLEPDNLESQLTCYCYLKQWLEAHMNYAKNGIRFITPDYKTLFWIPDGDQIRIQLRNGEHRDRVCRYVDSHHMEVCGDSNSNLYHICEFAELVEKNGATVIPLRSSLPEKCFSLLESTGEIIVITKGEKGYSPTGIYPQDDSPKEGVAALNASNGVTKAQEAAMVAGSMFGWDTPAADPRNYDENGLSCKKHSREKDAR